MTFLAGIYGMNFDFMPELRRRWDCFTLTGVMTAVALGQLKY